MTIMSDVHFRWMAKSPLFWLLFLNLAFYPMQLLFTDYLGSAYVIVPAYLTLSAYVLGAVAYLYGATGFYTNESTRTWKSLFKCSLVVVGGFLLLVAYVWADARWCMGLGGACGGPAVSYNPAF